MQYTLPLFRGKKMKSYATGQVAKICGFKSARIVAKMFDRDEIEGELVPSKYRRNSTRRIPLKALVEFMKRRRIPFDGFDGDIDAQKWILCQQTAEFKKMTEKAKKRSGVLFGFKGLPNALLDIVHNLDPLDNLHGVSEDRQRAAIFKKLIEVMELHVKLRGRIATSKK